MHLNEDISDALELLEQLRSDIAACRCPGLEDGADRDVKLLISALENPAVRGQALLQDSLGQLRRQLLQDPGLTVDGFDITFAGRLLLDDGHYCEPLYESADEDGDRRRNHLSTPAGCSKHDQLTQKRDNHDTAGHKPRGDELHGQKCRRPARHPWEGAELRHPLARPAVTSIQTAPPPPLLPPLLPPAAPLLSIPLQTAPVLLSAPQSPAILLQIPLLTAETAATAGLTINDLYLGRVPGGGTLPEEGGVAALFRHPSVESDRSVNGSDTASSVNSGSGWSKSSSIVRVSYGDHDRPKAAAAAAATESKRCTETSSDGATAGTTKETSPPLLPFTPDHQQRRSSPSPQPYPHPYPYPYPYPHPHPHQQQLLPTTTTTDDEFCQPDDAVWAPLPATIELVKGTRGLGFSIGEQRHPQHPSGAVVVVRSLVAGGVAQADGRLRPGDRLVSVNGLPLREGSLDEAVYALKGAPLGPVTVGVLRRVWREGWYPDDGHYEEIDEKKETRRRGGGQEQERRGGGGGGGGGGGDGEQHAGQETNTPENDGGETDKVEQRPKLQ